MTAAEEADDVGACALGKDTVSSTVTASSFTDAQVGPLSRVAALGYYGISYIIHRFFRIPLPTTRDHGDNYFTTRPKVLHLIALLERGPTSARKKP